MNDRYGAHYRPWLAQHFEEQGNPSAALEVWHRHFVESPRFETYQELQRLGMELGVWDGLSSTLLNKLDPQRHATLLIDIALEEKNIVRALEIISQPRALLSAEVRIRVAQAAEADYPRAALEIYRSRAERAIAARGRASYQIAAEHLLRVRALYRRLSEEAAWNTYITHLREDHRRLRALWEELDIAGL